MSSDTYAAINNGLESDLVDAFVLATSIGATGGALRGIMAS
jgi:hypothetical protein